MVEIFYILIVCAQLAVIGCRFSRDMRYRDTVCSSIFCRNSTVCTGCKTRKKTQRTIAVELSVSQPVDLSYLVSMFGIIKKVSNNIREVFLV
jgi:hypothetical protein